MVHGVTLKLAVTLRLVANHFLIVFGFRLRLNGSLKVQTRPLESGCVPSTALMHDSLETSGHLSIFAAAK